MSTFKVTLLIALAFKLVNKFKRTCFTKVLLSQFYYFTGSRLQWSSAEPQWTVWTRSWSWSHVPKMGSNLHCFINLSSTAAVDPSWGRGHTLDSSPVHHRPHWDKCVCFLQRRSSWTVSPLSGRSYRMEIQVAECLWFYIWFFWSDMAEFSCLLPQGPCLPWRFFFHRSCWYSNVFFGCILSFGRMSGCWSFMNSSTGVLIWFLLLSSVSPCFVSLLPSFSVFFLFVFLQWSSTFNLLFPLLDCFFF